MLVSMADWGPSSSLFAVVGRDTFVLCGTAGAVGALWKPGRYPRFEMDPDWVDVCSRNGPSSEGIGALWAAFDLLGLRRRLLEALENRPPVLCPSFRRRDPVSVVVLMLTIRCSAPGLCRRIWIMDSGRSSVSGLDFNVQDRVYSAHAERHLFLCILIFSFHLNPFLI
jgi:hypothetical protein